MRIIILIRKSLKARCATAGRHRARNRSTRVLMNPLVSAGESISRAAAYARGCLRTCAYIDTDSDVTTRFSESRLIFITSFSLGNSKHILITFFTERTRPRRLKSELPRRSIALAGLFSPSLVIFSRWNILSISSDLTSVPAALRASPNLSLAQKSATKHPTSTRATRMNRKPSRAVFATWYSRREKPSRLYAFSWKRFFSFWLLRVSRVFFFYYSCIFLAPQKSARRAFWRLSVTFLSLCRHEYFNRFIYVCVYVWTCTCVWIFLHVDSRKTRSDFPPPSSTLALQFS